jgi:hypothetical protein
MSMYDPHLGEGYAKLKAELAAARANLTALRERMRWRADELHAAMLLAVWDVQDHVGLCLMHPVTSLDLIIRRDQHLAQLQDARNTAARRYFAAVGE